MKRVNKQLRPVQAKAGKKTSQSIAYRQHAMKRRRKKYYIIGAIAGVLLLAMIIVYLCCGVKTVLIEGNNKYSDAKVKELVLPSRGQYNTMYQYIKLKLLGPPEIDYFDMVSIEIVSNDTLLIHVYEKEMVGCVEQNGTYVCFDRDGTVVEITDKSKGDAPMIEGLNFEEPVLYQPLEVEDAKVFNTLVMLSQLIEKQNLKPDRICFMSDQTIELTFDEVVVKLGKDEHLDNKIARLSAIMETLTGHSGVLDMSNVDESTKEISFLKTQSEAEKQAQAEAEAAAQAEAEAAQAEEEENSEDEWTPEENTEDNSEDEWTSEENTEDNSEDEWTPEENTEDNSESGSEEE